MRIIKELQFVQGRDFRSCKPGYDSINKIQTNPEMDWFNIIYGNGDELLIPKHQVVSVKRGDRKTNISEFLFYLPSNKFNVSVRLYNVLKFYYDNPSERDNEKIPKNLEDINQKDFFKNRGAGVRSWNELQNIIEKL